MSNPVARVAEQWVGQHFRPGQKEQCAAFVRAMFLKVGIDLPNAANPSDRRLIPEEPLGPGYANSFAGDEVGPKVPFTGLLPGDIVMFRNTYGNYPRGVITHVGIYVGGGMMVHRPTSDRTVEQAGIASGFWRDLFAEARRPKEFLAAPTAKKRVRVKLTSNPRGFTLTVPDGLEPGAYPVVASDAWYEVEAS